MWSVSDSLKIAFIVTSPRVHLTKPELTIIAMDVQACWRGPGVSIHQMAVDPRSASEAKPQNIRLCFDKWDRKSLVQISAN